MKKSKITFLTLFLFVSLLFSQDAFSQNEYANRFPMVAVDHANIRNFPSLNESEVLFQLNSNDRVIIRYETIETDKIYEEEYPWYFISVFDGPNANQNGWIFGQLLSFRNGYDKEYWNNSVFSIQEISRKVPYRAQYSNQLIENFIGVDNPIKVSIDYLQNYELIDSRPASLWYMVESGYLIENTYETEFGSILAFVNEDENLWSIIALNINQPTTEYGLSVGMPIESINNIFGDESYTIEGDTMRFQFNEWFESYYLQIQIDNETINSITLYRYYT